MTNNMGVYENVNCKIQGQIKPVENGRLFWAEIEMVCAKYDVRVDKWPDDEQQGVEKTINALIKVLSDKTNSKMIESIVEDVREELS